MMSFTRVTEVTISCMVFAAVSTSAGLAHGRGRQTLQSALDLFRCVGAFPPVTDFTRHHRKPAPLLTRTRRFPQPRSAPECWSERNAINHADDVANFLQLAAIFHGAGHMRHWSPPSSPSSPPVLTGLTPGARCRRSGLTSQSAVPCWPPFCASEAAWLLGAGREIVIASRNL